MADKKKDEGAVAAAEKTLNIPCLGPCAEKTDHDDRGSNSAQCRTCQNVRRTDVGHGSPIGKRWFVTKYPEWTTTVVPEDDLLGEGSKKIRQKSIRVAFKKQIKPRKLVSHQGELGTDNIDGGDKNASRWIGVFEVVDPGPDFDDRTINSDTKPSERKKIVDRMMINHLRRHENYRKTAQDNRLSPNPELVELNWDPSLKGKGEGTPVSRRVTMGPEGEVEPEAPQDSIPGKPAARVGLTRKPVAIAEGE